MRGVADETVGAGFQNYLLELARDKTLALIREAAKEMKAGVSEAQAKFLISEIQTRMGAPKSWHPPQIRFGKNTLLGFGEKGSEGAVLAENDIFFFDLGPIFESHEGDVGRTFFIGSNAEMQKCCHDVEAIWFLVRDHWKNNGVSGTELYDFAKRAASDGGWVLTLDQANGHRIADFPHAARSRGSIEGFEQAPAPNRWILEIQIRHPERPFGAFYEDLLN